MGSQRVRHDRAHMHTYRYMNLLKKFDLFLVKKLISIIVNKMPYLLFSCVVVIIIVIT